MKEARCPGVLTCFQFHVLAGEDLVQQGEEGDIGLMGARSWCTAMCQENQTQILEHCYLQGHWATFRVAQEGRKGLEKTDPASKVVTAGNMGIEV